MTEFLSEQTWKNKYYVLLLLLRWLVQWVNSLWILINKSWTVLIFFFFWRDWCDFLLYLYFLPSKDGKCLIFLIAKHCWWYLMCYMCATIKFESIEWKTLAVRCYTTLRFDSIERERETDCVWYYAALRFGSME